MTSSKILMTVAALLVAAGGVVGTPAVAAPKTKPQVAVDLKTMCAKGGELSFNGQNGTHAQARKDAGCPMYAPASIIGRVGKGKDWFALRY